jgi:CRISPR/Cas system-associated protein Cas10 (large subunit of type III CRISPR-Cas system)
MKALKCDVCRKLYEYGKKNGYIKIGIYNDRNDDGRLYDSRSFDLCPECFEKVKQVLRINDESEGETV